MNAHSARFSARRKGSGEPKPQVFLKVLAQKSSNRRVSAEVATRNCSRTYAELCGVLNLIPEEPSYGDGGILYHGCGAEAAPRRFGGGSYSAVGPMGNWRLLPFLLASCRGILLTRRCALT